MSLEGAIQEMGLHEVGQLLSLSRKSGVLEVSSVLRGQRAWIRFAGGAIVDAGKGATPVSGEATDAAAAGDRPAVEEAVLDVLGWAEGHFAFRAAPRAETGGSTVRIPTDAMLVEVVRREDAWSGLRDRLASPEVVPSFVDVEPKALPLLKLVPQEWEVLTRVDGSRDLRALAAVLERDLLEVAEVVHRLVGTGLLSVREGSVTPRPMLEAPAADSTVERVAGEPMREVAELPPPRVDGRTPDEALAAGGPSAAEFTDGDELWIPDRDELAAFTEPSTGDDAVFDPQRAGLLTAQGLPERVSAPAAQRAQATVTLPATPGVASVPVEPSAQRESAVLTEEAEANARYWRGEGDAAVRRGDLDRALTCWRQSLRVAPSAHDAAMVREAVALTVRLQALLTPDETD